MYEKMFETFGIKYFTPNEIKRGWDVPDNLITNIFPTLRALDKLREDYGKPIYVNSTYRSPEYNRAVGGKMRSLHLEFNAIDFTVENHFDLVQLYRTLDGWDKNHFFEFLPKPYSMGIGRYNTFIHLDTRAVLGRITPARW